MEEVLSRSSEFGTVDAASDSKLHFESVVVMREYLATLQLSVHSTVFFFRCIRRTEVSDLNSQPEQPPFSANNVASHR